MINKMNAIKRSQLTYWLWNSVNVMWNFQMNEISKDIYKYAVISNKAVLTVRKKIKISESLVCVL